LGVVVVVDEAFWGLVSFISLLVGGFVGVCVVGVEVLLKDHKHNRS
jgi:hypothetical protein